MTLSIYIEFITEIAELLKVTSKIMLRAEGIRGLKTVDNMIQQKKKYLSDVAREKKVGTQISVQYILQLILKKENKKNLKVLLRKECIYV